MSERGYMELGDAATFSHQPVEGYDLVKKGSTRSQLTASVHEQISGMVLDAPHWLPFAAEPYRISADLKDYVIVPVDIMPSDIPNRNGVAFSYTELTRFNIDSGQLAFATWKGKPTHLEHQNRDPTIAKGVIFASVMTPIERSVGDLWRVSLLLGFDRNRDAALAGEILTRKRTSYSMGALCRDYRCSICNASTNRGGCDHVHHGKPEFKEFGGQLAYLIVEDFVGFECSSVATPAFHCADNPDFLVLK